MTNFRTTLPKFDYPFKINHQSLSLCIGSCFAEQMGQLLAKYQFPTLINPFGILYNPISIAQQLTRAVQEDFYTAEELFEHQEIWNHFLFHSRFSGPGKETVLAQLNHQLKQTKDFLKQADQLIVTLGTSRVFINKKDQKVVANCHKMPGSYFDKKQCTVSECVRSLSTVFDLLKKENPRLNIILTVSPIRHVRDGLIENQLSKSTLLLAASELSQQYKYVYYFPAWELIMDDLRDYRFYESDMIHPNETAIDYVWSYFKTGLFSEETNGLLAKIKKVILASQHRPFQIKSEQHQTFLRKQLEEIKRLSTTFPFLKFETEKGLLESQLNEGAV